MNHTQSLPFVNNSHCYALSISESAELKHKCPHVHWPGNFCGPSIHDVANVSCLHNSMPQASSRTSIRQRHSTVKLPMREKSSWKSTLCSTNINSHNCTLTEATKDRPSGEHQHIPTTKVENVISGNLALQCLQSIHNEISNHICSSLFATLVIQAKHLQHGYYAE